MIGWIWVDCEKKDVTMVQNELEKLISGINHVEVTKYQDELKMTQYSTSLMKLGVYSFLAIIGLIGFMNMANTMITSIVTRRQEFGVLQAIGMTNKQLNHMLQLDGLIFTIGCVLVAIVVGTPIGYGIFLYGKKNSLIGMSVYRFPIMEIGFMILIITILQIILSYILSRNIKKASLVDRIRYQE